ncbi:MAG: phosphotransferase [Bacilli bacterium]|nr:phosphotransferase [Bacilli bacterium]
MKQLIPFINQFYNLQIYDVLFVRKMVGTVYELKGKDADYILKCYPQSQKSNVLGSLDFIRYLNDKKLNSLRVLKSKKGEYIIHLEIDDQDMIGVLFTYIKGVEPNIDYDFDRLLKHLKQIHDQMLKYPGKINYNGQKYYLDRCLELMMIKDYSTLKLIELRIIGKDLYQHIEELPRSFCHGDYHTGNMIKDLSGEITLLDFDASNNASNLIDVATICDQTDFNKLTKRQFDQTHKTILYSQEHYREYTQEEIISMMAFIPLRHFELIATIGNAKGLNEISMEFLDEQYHWIKLYKEYFDDWNQKPL